MGKKGSWFSAIKRAFTTSSKDKFLDTRIQTQDFESKLIREKRRWGFGKSKQGENNSFIPLHKEPSSIEKILEDAENEQRQRMHLMPRKKIQQSKSYTPTPNIIPNYAHISAIRIQAAYKGHQARRSYRALKGLMRLQRVMRGQNVKRQTTNTMKCMQMLVKVQSEIHSRRLQMMENRTRQLHQPPQRSEKDIDSNFGKCSVHRTEVDGHEQWDDSTLAKEELETRMRRKVEAVIKRERALAYAYSHQLLKVTPISAEAMLSGLRSGSAPWWWTWLERQLPADHPDAVPPDAQTPRVQTQRPPSAHRPSITPPTPVLGAPQGPRRHHRQHWRPKPEEADDASLTSCPPFAVPNYMAPTVSAKAKVRVQHANQEPRKKRFSFGLSQSIGSLFAGKEAVDTSTAAAGGPQRMGGRHGTHRSMGSVGGMSMDSAVSLPVGLTTVGGRRSIKFK